LIATKLACDLFEAHAGRMRIVGTISSPLTPALSPFERGEGDGPVKPIQISSALKFFQF
jgi:hypothetical protein